MQNLDLTKKKNPFALPYPPLKLTEVRHDRPVNAISFLPAYETNSHRSLAPNNMEPSNQTDDISFSLYVASEVWCTISLSYDGSLYHLHTNCTRSKILGIMMAGSAKWITSANSEV